MNGTLKKILIIIFIVVIAGLSIYGGALLVSWGSGIFIFLGWGMILGAILGLFILAIKLLRFYTWRFLGILFLLSYLYAITATYLTLINIFKLVIYYSILIYVFRYYRMKSLRDSEPSGNIISDIKIMFQDIKEKVKNWRKR